MAAIKPSASVYTAKHSTLHSTWIWTTILMYISYTHPNPTPAPTPSGAPPTPTLLQSGPCVKRHRPGGNLVAYVTVTVSYPIPVFVPFIGSMFGNSSPSKHTDTGSVTWRVEPCGITQGA